MSNTESSVVIDTNVGIVDKIKNILCSKKGLYLLGAILLIGAIYYYSQSSKKSKSKKSKNLSEEELTDIPEPPPGYVTVPVEMLQGLQQDQMYANVPENQPNNQLQTQQIPLPEPPRPQAVPQLKHNSVIEDDEEDDIAAENLTKEEMDSIQVQLNAMQRESI